MTYRGFLAELLMAECDDRARRSSERRIKAASQPTSKPTTPRDIAPRSSIEPAGPTAGYPPRAAYDGYAEDRR